MRRVHGEGFNRGMPLCNPRSTVAVLGADRARRRSATRPQPRALPSPGRPTQGPQMVCAAQMEDCQADSNNDVWTVQRDSEVSWMGVPPSGE